MLSNKPRRVAPPAAKPAARVAAPTGPQPAKIQNPVPRVPLDPEESSPLRTISFYFGVALLFTRISVLPELLANVAHTNFYILYLLTPPALAGVFVTSAFRRTLKAKAARYWMAFFVWMIIATGFSSWIGGSLARVKDYGIYDLMLLFVVGGLATNWREVRVLFYGLAASGMMNLIEARFFMDLRNGRMQLWENGIISNANDLSSQLLLVLPFILWIALGPNRNLLLRVPAFFAVIYGLWVVVGTASRGALIGIFAAFLYALWRANMRQRVIAVLAGAALAVIMTLALPQVAATRLGSLFGERDIEAEQSAEARSHLFWQSLLYTSQHPIFGVGPDQFSNYQSQEHEVKQAMWHPTHCAWTQVSSECGVPALIFFVLGLGSAIFGVSRLYKTARERGNAEVAAACFCYLLAMTGFLTSITFLSNAYSVSIPVMVGLGISISAAGSRLLAKTPSPMMPALVRY